MNNVNNVNNFNFVPKSTICWSSFKVTSTKRSFVLFLKDCFCFCVHVTHTHTYKSCSIQYLPVSRSQMLVELSTFAATVYNTRPVGWSEATKFNSGGTGFMHQFYMWTLVRHLNPKHIIESGSYNGLGTSILRKAAPEAQITVVSPRTPHVYVDKHNKSRYFTEDSFCDFSTIDWNNAKHLILQVPTLPCL